MLIDIPGEADRTQYAFQMVKRNKMKGILPCRERIEDGKATLYLDITGKRSLLQEYADKEMELDDILLLFQQLTAVFDELKNFLLSERLLLLEPEYIYRDMQDESLYVTLLPWERQEEASLHGLAEFLLEKINHRDEHGVTAAYQFYRMQSQPQFSLVHFLPVLEKESILNRQKIKNDVYSGGEDRQNVPLPEEVTANWSVESENFPRDEPEEKKHRGWVAAAILGVVYFTLILLPFGEKPQKAALLSLGLGILLLAFAWKIMLVIRHKGKAKKAGKSEKTEKPEEERTTSCRNENLAVKEQTVFFQPREAGLCLQWKEGGRKKSYPLTDLPLTVGKIPDEVSILMQDKSVSRIHCRFVEKEGRVALMDMNSTNGTWLNGMRLKQGEIIEIEKNDEILIGKVRVIVVYSE
jgi:hypothetical protein